MNLDEIQEAWEKTIKSKPSEMDLVSYNEFVGLMFKHWPEIRIKLQEILEPK